MEYKFEWTDEMSVNNEIIDNQHKKLLNQVNVVLGNFINGNNDEAIQSSLSFFDSYINEHLKFEDEYMLANGYPKIVEHDLMHKDFIKHYEEFKEKIKNNTPKDIIVTEIENFIGSWWIEHIGKADHEYAEFIKNKS